MSQLPAFDRDRLAAALDRMGLHYLCTSHGGFAALFSPASAAQLQAEIFFSVGGVDGDVLGVNASVARVFGADDWPGLLGAINDWHHQHRWPTGHLDYLPVEPGQPPLARLVAEWHMPFAAGVHDELLAEVLAVAVDSSLAFLRQLCPPLAPRSRTITDEALERWLS